MYGVRRICSVELSWGSQVRQGVWVCKRRTSRFGISEQRAAVRGDECSPAPIHALCHGASVVVASCQTPGLPDSHFGQGRGGRQGGEHLSTTGRVAPKSPADDAPPSQLCLWSPSPSPSYGVNMQEDGTMYQALECCAADAIGSGGSWAAQLDSGLVNNLGALSKTAPNAHAQRATSPTNSIPS